MYKLLIVEDEALERSALRTIIERQFKNIKLLPDATNGIEAIERVRENVPNIILMDIKMPDMNGFETLSKILKITPNVRPIVLTAHSKFEYAQKAIKLGVCDYLLKPARPSIIVSSITKVISSLPSSSMIDTESAPDANYSIHLAIDYIKKNYYKNLSLDTVAAQVFLNPQYFSRVFKHQTGLTFIDYLSQTRINVAKELLISTNKSINSISFSVGYLDQSYFSKVFSKYEGVTPLKYRIIHNK